MDEFDERSVEESCLGSPSSKRICVYAEDEEDDQDQENDFEFEEEEEEDEEEEEEEEKSEGEEDITQQGFELAVQSFSQEEEEEQQQQAELKDEENEIKLNNEKGRKHPPMGHLDLNSSQDEQPQANNIHPNHHHHHQHHAAPNFAEIIIEKLMAQQRMFMASPDLMKRQPHITDHVRAMLIDWIVEIAEEYSFLESSLFLAVSLLDRLLSRFEVRANKLQLVGVTCLMIAVKNLESADLDVHDFVRLSDNLFTKREIVHMEARILELLDFKINAPTVHTFLQYFHKVARLDDEAIQLSNYLSELALLDCHFLMYEPSTIAMSAIALASHTLGSDARIPSLRWYQNPNQLNPCVSRLHALYHASGHMQLIAIQEKYRSANPYLCVATIPAPQTPPTLAPPA
jgi:cyclin A